MSCAEYYESAMDIDYWCSVRDIVEARSSVGVARIIRLRAFTIYTQARTWGKTIEEIVELLINYGLDPKFILVECSTSECDWHFLKMMFVHAGKAHMFPGEENRRMLTRLWQSTLPGVIIFEIYS